MKLTEGKRDSLRHHFIADGTMLAHYLREENLTKVRQRYWIIRVRLDTLLAIMEQDYSLVWGSDLHYVDECGNCQPLFPLWEQVIRLLEREGF